MGRTDEQHPQSGGGNHLERTDLQLEKSEPQNSVANEDEVRANLPTVDEQIEMIAEAEDEKSSAFSVSQEDIDSALTRGSGFQNGKYRIYRQLWKGENSKDNIAFLKREYGTGGGTHDYPDGTRGGVWCDAKGIAIEKYGSYTDPDLRLSWSKVEKRLRELIKNDRYLNSKEKEHYPDYLEKAEAPQYEIDTQRKIQRQVFIDSKRDLPPADKRDTLALRLSDFVRDLDGYEKNLLSNVERTDLSDVTAEQMEQHLSDPATVQQLIDFLKLVQGKTSDVYSRSNAWRFGQELLELHPLHYLYHEGDVVYIDAYQYEIMTISEDSVSLQNVEFPLFGKEFSRGDLEEKLKESLISKPVRKVCLLLKRSRNGRRRRQRKRNQENQKSVRRQTMIKTLRNLFKQDKEKFVVPKSVQAVIPIKTIWEDGIFLVGKNKYAKTFKFEDINYAVASREDKEAMFLEYSELLNALDSGATTKITINNRRLNKADFEQTILIPMAEDGLDKYRTEYNKMLLDKATGANSIVQDKYVTISVCKKNIEEARHYFARVGADLIGHFSRLGSKCTELDAEEKLRIFHDFYRTGEETAFCFDMVQSMKKGHDFKDYICPDTFEFEKDYFRIGNRYGRVILLREYAAYIKDSMVAELCELNRNMMLSVDVVPVPTDEAVREVENRLLGVETNITNWQRKQNQNNNFSAVIPYDLEQQRKESKEFLDDLTTRDQRMMFAVLTMVHTSETKEQLDNDTEALLTTARKHLCQFAVLKYQQMDGLNTALPFGVRKIDALRTLTTESLAVFIPFRVQEIYHENGVYYGQNVISKNMIIANRRHLLNGNSFILGVSGAGKSFTAKEEMTNIILTDPNADVIIIDPEREYSPLVKAMQGEVIHISATSENHINAMDMNSDYGDGANPVILKSEFILSLCEQLIGGSTLGAKQKSIIDRCTASVYRYYQQGNYQGTPPTLQDFREELLKQNEPEAQEIALAIELFTDGSLNTFAKHTNVDTKSRLICYDILDLGKQLQPIGMLVVLDSILNRITQNRAKGRNTFIFIDEIYLLFQHEYSANFLFTLWKRVRKYGAYCTGITQNVDDLLQSHTARTMLANSEFIIMLNQASTDRLELAKLLNISDLQMSYITNVGAGQGLLKVGSSLVPFVNKFPRNTELYRLMTTKFGEV